MKPLDIVIIIILASAFIAALIFTLRNSKKGCSGNCANCSKGCRKSNE